MITIKAKVGVSQSTDVLTLYLDYLQEEWESLTEDEQREKIQDEINENPNQPYWVLEDC